MTAETIDQNELKDSYNSLLRECEELRQRVDQLEALVNAYARTFKLVALTIANHNAQFNK